MKTYLTLLLAAALAGPVLATEGTLPACCAKPPTAEKTRGPLVSKSLYQLDANWTDDAGRTVTLADFRGEPVAVAMIFTHCEYACPAIVNDLRRMRELLPPDVRARARLVLISFDTVRDTPAALAEYRARENLDGQWTLLHGRPEDVRSLAMLLGVKYQQDSRGQFSHSNLTTILNPEGEIVHQHAGLFGDLAPVAGAMVAAAKD